MMKWPEENCSWKFFFFLWLVVCLGYYGLFFAKARVDLKIEVEQTTWFKLFWAEDGQSFSDEQMARILVRPGRKSYSFYLPNLDGVQRLRMDTHEYRGKAIVENITIRQKGFADLELLSADNRSSLAPLGQIQHYTLTKTGLMVDSSGRDPNFVLRLQRQSQPIDWLTEIFRLAVLGGIVFLVYGNCAQLVNEYQFVPLCLAAVLVLVFTIIFTTRQNGHPDEFVHVAAVEYYTDHLLPPKVDANGIGNTYSPYGTSRLHTNEIYYLLAGKFAQVMEPFAPHPYIGCRLFNGFLFLVIFLYTVRVVEARIVALPLLISPQIWYLYSYCNSDAFALTICFFAACQLVVSDSLFHRVWQATVYGGMLVLCCILGVGLGLLLLLKLNYLPFLAMLLLVLVIRYRELNEQAQQAVLLKKAAVVFLVGIGLFMTKKGADYWVNGPDRQLMLATVRTAHAQHAYSPESSLAETLSSMHMKDRGVSLQEMVTTHHWLEKTFRSTFGVYGYLSIVAGDRYYQLVGWSVLLLALFLFGSIFIRGRPLGLIYGGATILCAIALLAASLNHSWTADFQPQGRYLFAVVPIVGFLCGQYRHQLNQRWLSLLTVWMFLLSLYSYISVALLNFPKLILA